MGFNDINLQVSGPQQPASIYKTRVLKGQVPFATQVTEPNTKYVIKHNFELDADVTIPANCILEFDGGNISGTYTITGTNTGISAGLVKIFGTDVTLAGTWNVAEAYPEWFGAVGDGVTNDTAAIQKTISLAERSSIRRCQLCSKRYYITTIHVAQSVEFCGCFSRNRATLNSGTVLMLHGDSDHHIYIEPSCYIHDISIMQPEIIDKPLTDGEWTETQISESFTKACIYAEGVAANCVRIENITFILVAIGIKFTGNHELLYINNVVGACLINGILLSTSSDVDRILHCHFNGNYIGNGGIVDNTIKTAVYKYIYRYSAALSFRRLDGAIIDDLFVYGHRYGIYNANSLHEAGIENITNSGFDACVDCMLLYNSGVRISKCWFTSFDTWNTGVKGNSCITSSHSGGTTIIDNCWFRDYQRQSIRGVNVKINNCKFDSSTRQVDGAINLVLTDGTSYMSNCLFILKNQPGNTRAIHVTEGAHLLLQNTTFKGHPNPNLGVIAIDATGPKGQGHLNGSNNVAIDDNNAIQQTPQMNILNATLNRGNTAKRANTYALQYYDTELLKPVFSDGQGGWVDATGTPV